MLEMLLATAVGGVVLAGAYSSYIVISKQNERVRAFAEVQQAGMPTIQLIARDLRMAGREALDSDLDSVFGTITTPITITDSGDACCDTVEIIYDKSSTERRKVTYYTGARTNPTRTALYMDIDLWDGASWDSSVSQSLVSDYVDDFQLEGSDDDANGNPMIVDVAVVLRSKSSLGVDTEYTRPDQVIGNYNFDFNDKYHRDVFTMTVNIKNLRQ